MASLRCFTQEARDELLRSAVNTSSSKASWTFAKQQRFPVTGPVCPVLMYEHIFSAHPRQNRHFGSSVRKVFTEASGTPGPDQYLSVSCEKTKSISFGMGREQCHANSYIDPQKLTLPGPGAYNKRSEHPDAAYTMRPRTANSRTYFLDDRQKAAVPSPFSYNIASDIGKRQQPVSKFRSVTGGTNMAAYKTARFDTYKVSATPSRQYSRPVSHYSKRGGIIGSAPRTSFVDYGDKRTNAPGPGNYRLPTDFGHYGLKH